MDHDDTKRRPEKDEDVVAEFNISWYFSITELVQDSAYIYVFRPIYSFLFLRQASNYLVQADFEREILLLLLPECWS